MKKIKKADLGKLLSQWQPQFAVLTPSRKGETVSMSAWDGQETGFPEWYHNTTIPPKNCFLPNMESIFRFRKGLDGVHLETPPAAEKPQLVFGIRPCDARAAALLDIVFQDSYQDSYYLDRRRNTVLVGLGCTRPGTSCFCTSLGIDPAKSEHVDLMFTDTGDEFFIEAITEKGKEMLAGDSVAAEANQDDAARAAENQDAIPKKVTRQLATAGIDQKLKDIFEDQAFWEKVAAKCVSCGVCTFLCPTCHCFDINDEMTRKSGARWRNWDSCSFPLYTRMPMENPREQKWQRIRQKVSHKYLFFPELFGSIACTGCGRCVRLCPVNWDITRTLESLPAAAAATTEK